MIITPVKIEKIGKLPDILKEAREVNCKAKETNEKNILINHIFKRISDIALENKRKVDNIFK